LSEGEHDFSFHLGEQFFTSFEGSEITRGELIASVVMDNRAGALTLRFHLEGEVEVVCDRCLDPFLTEIRSVQQLIVKRGDVPGELDDDVIVIGRDDHEIDIRQYLYELVVLAIPCKRIHPLDKNGEPTCNPEMIKILESHRGKKDRREDKLDPRWNALKEITGNKN